MSAVFRSAKAPAFADCIGSTLSANYLTITSESHCLSPRKCRPTSVAQKTIPEKSNTPSPPKIFSWHLEEFSILEMDDGQ
ncbi:MAG: hypothetical protein DWH78_02435 [Planctomycetota bacterium]|nr:MAG: hypothetical protein DWH78_02435 [Planctomycetota bacterium]